jgi:hypothetical protein
MPLDQSDVTFLLWIARNHYRSGLKSSNKIYANPIFPKQARRNINAQDAQTKIDELRANRSATQTSVEYGRSLLDNNTSFGNCDEMCAVVLEVCRHHLGGRCKRALSIYIDPGDHVFVLLSEDGSLPDFSAWQAGHPQVNPDPGDVAGNIQGLSYAGDTFWVIDCWLNVACRAAEYPLRARMKLNSWAAQNKHVKTKYGLQIPNHDEYTVPFFFIGALCIDCDVDLANM